MLKYPWLSSLETQFAHWMSTGRPHAILFLGTEAVALSAMQCFAALSLCQHSACGQCQDCLRLEQGLHPNCTLIGFEDQTTVGVDVIRSLSQSLGLQAKQTQFVLLHAAKLNPAASNAFLKSLEEPQGNVCFLLYAPSAHHLLPTLVSRCVQCVMPNPSFEQALNYLEKLGVTNQNATIALKQFDGCPLTAQAFLEQDQKQKHDKILDGFLALLDKTTDPVTLTEQWLKEKLDNALYLLHSLICDLCFITVGSQNKVKNQHLMLRLTAIANKIDVSTALRWMQSWQHASRQLQSPSANPRLVMLQFLVEMKS